jgi:hypothetical protein
MPSCSLLSFLGLPPDGDRGTAGAANSFRRLARPAPAITPCDSAAGKHVGRPPLDPELQQRIARLWNRQPRPTVYRIAQDLGISFKTASKYVRALGER